MPSDHALISLTMELSSTGMEYLKCSAEYLGDHALSHGQARDELNSMKKPVPMKNVDSVLFLEETIKKNKFLILVVVLIRM